jgi:hypothetical protein
MTTGNKIVTKTISDVTFIPLESVQAGNDSIPFVYLKKGDRQIVVLGESNENNVVIEKGLEPGEMVYLSTPAKPDGFKIKGDELIAVIKEKERVKREEEKHIREEAAKAAARMGSMAPGGMGPGGNMQITPEMMQRFQGMRGQGGGQRGGQGAQGTAGGAAPANQGAGQTAIPGAQGAGQGFQPGQGQGRTRDTAAMRRFMNMRNDTAAMRRFRQMRQQGGAPRDTARRSQPQSGQPAFQN